MAVKIKLSNSDEFSEYIDIGRAYRGCLYSFNWLLAHSYIERGLGLEKWIEDFKNSSYGFQIDIINYFFLNADFPTPEIEERLTKEKKLIKKILNRYFDDDSSLFLDCIEFYNLDKDDGWIIKEEIFEDELEDEFPIEIHFEDGTVVYSPNKEDIRYGCYMAVEDYEKFASDVQILVDIMFDEN